MAIPGIALNEEVEGSLTQMLAAGRFPHAAIIEGGAASLRRELAGYIARALVCTGADKPCGICSACNKAAKNLHPDIIDYSVEDKPKAFKVDIVREIRSLSYVVPNESDMKVFILNNSHTMGPEGQNAFLKILEEPPEYVTFLLLCTSKAGFLPTVLSRATVFSLGDAINDEAQQSMGAQALEAAAALARGCVAADELDILVAAAAFEKNKELLRLALPLLEEIFASALRSKYGVPSQDDFGDVPGLLARSLTADRLLTIIGRVRELEESLAMSANYNLLLTRLCTCLRRAAQ